MTPQDASLRSLAIAAPAFNEAAGIEAFVRSWLETLSRKVGLQYAEIVVCNDGSRDDTGAILDRLQAESPLVRPVHLARNRGAAQAMAAAIAHTTADWVLLLDSDGQFPPGCLDVFERARRDMPSARAFVGARTKKDDSTFARVGAWTTTRALNTLWSTQYEDLSSACQLLDGRLLRSLPIEARGLNYSVEISARLLECGVRPVQVAIEHVARPAGRSTRTLVRSTFERASFVGYFAARRALINAGVLADPRGMTP